MHHQTLIIAITFIMIALVLYTVGVWSERIQRKLMWWHAILFWCGFTADTIGTTAMSILSGTLFAITFHGLTGNIAISLMGFHAIWATVVLIRKNEKMIHNFHRFSIFVWIIWLIPMISGAIFGASR
jgi:uncharacterized repeat protein (TIGR03987 family)